jgi:nucleoside-diphosphate-sugar epimerase
MGAGGFIGSHMVSRLKSEGYSLVVGVDLKYPSFSPSRADHFLIGDCTRQEFMASVILGQEFDEIYQFAADMGGAGYIFTGENDFNVMSNSASINLTLCDLLVRNYQNGISFPKIFYSSSACIYPEERQTDSSKVDLREENAYPANPDSEYGWEKLFSERLFLALHRNLGAEVRVARFHNVYGPMGTWFGGKEKAPAAICRKVASSKDGTIEVWGDGEQTRSFLFIEDCIEAVRRFMNQPDFSGPLNIGSEEMVTINQLVAIAARVEGKVVSVKHVDGPTGVRGRNSNNELIRRILGWDYKWTLEEGIKETYLWIKSQIETSDKT